MSETKTDDTNRSRSMQKRIAIQKGEAMPTPESEQPMTDAKPKTCVCGDPEGTNDDCERCTLLSHLAAAQERITRLERACDIFEKNSADATAMWEALQAIYQPGMDRNYLKSRGWEFYSHTYLWQHGKAGKRGYTTVEAVGFEIRHVFENGKPEDPRDAKIKEMQEQQAAQSATIAALRNELAKEQRNNARVICCCGRPLDGSHDHNSCGPPIDLDEEDAARIQRYEDEIAELTAKLNSHSASNSLTMSETKLTEIRERRSKITKLPWWRTDPPFGHGTTVHAGPSDDPHTATCYIAEGDIVADGLTAEEVAENMDFIANAPTDIDTLLSLQAAQAAELERVRGERDAAVADHESAMKAMQTIGYERDAARTANDELGKQIARLTEDLAMQKRLHDAACRMSDSVWADHRKTFDGLTAKLQAAETALQETPR